MTYPRAREHESRRQVGTHPHSLCRTVSWLICWGWDGGRCSTCEGRLRLQLTGRHAAPSQGTAGPWIKVKAPGKGSWEGWSPSRSQGWDWEFLRPPPSRTTLFHIIPEISSLGYKLMLFPLHLRELIQKRYLRNIAESFAEYISKILAIILPHGLQRISHVITFLLGLSDRKNVVPPDGLV